MCWLELRSKHPRAVCLYSIAFVAFPLLVAMQICHKVQLFSVYQEFNTDDDQRLNYFFDKLNEECPEESFSITRSVLSRDLNSRAELYTDLQDHVVPLTGFWIFVTIF